MDSELRIRGFGKHGVENVVWGDEDGVGEQGGGGDKLGSSERGFSLWIKGVTAV